MKRIILASQSPRRRGLLKSLGLTFEAYAPNIDEAAASAGVSDPADAAVKTAEAKARHCARLYKDALVIAADTVVSIDGQTLGKPADADDAARMLRLLSGRTHRVFTGVCVAEDGREMSFAEETKVTFKTLTDEDIAAYTASGEPFDKAGAYAAQEKGALLVERVDGDFYNVVGLPICRLNVALKNFEIDLMAL